MGVQKALLHRRTNSRLPKLSRSQDIDRSSTLGSSRNVKVAILDNHLSTPVLIKNLTNQGISKANIILIDPEKYSYLTKVITDVRTAENKIIQLNSSLTDSLNELKISLYIGPGNKKDQDSRVWGEENCKTSCVADELDKRELFERDWFQTINKEELPFMGICGSAQSFAVKIGKFKMERDLKSKTFTRHLPSQLNNTNSLKDLNVADYLNDTHYFHPIQPIASTFMSFYYDKEEKVNSFHNQSVSFERYSDEHTPIKISTYEQRHSSSLKVAESWEMVKQNRLHSFGVQFHPEYYQKGQKYLRLALFSAIEFHREHHLEAEKENLNLPTTSNATSFTPFSYEKLSQQLCEINGQKKINSGTWQQTYSFFQQKQFANQKKQHVIVQQHRNFSLPDLEPILSQRRPNLVN